MTKIWKQISFWNKLKAIFISLGVGSEFALYIVSVSTGWHVAIGVATALAVVITHVIEDKDNNGIVDLFQKKNERQTKQKN